MNVKELIINDFSIFQELHTNKDIEAKVTYHLIFGKIILAAQLKLITQDDANIYIEVLTGLYDTLPSRI